MRAGRGDEVDAVARDRLVHDDPLDREGSHGVFDYSVGVDFTYKNLTLNVSYVGTDMDRSYANLNYGAGTHSGRKITKGDIVGSLTASF